MEALDERPVWSMSGSEMLSALDQIDADFARLQNRWLELVAGLDATGYAAEIGAHVVVQLLTLRHRLERAQVARDVRLARALPKYAAVSAGLTEGVALPPADNTADDLRNPNAADDAGVRLMRPEQAETIVSALERVRSRVPVEHLDVAETELVKLSARLPLAELRKSARQICELLDVDGPEPDETKAYERESLTLTNAPQGVKFRGYLANENAEALRATVYTGARPHKTPTGDLDPRPREKRQADALSAALALAATATDAGLTRPPTPAAPRTSTAASPTDSAASPTGTGVSPSAPAASPAGEPSTATAGPVIGLGVSAGRWAEWVPGYGAKANITVTIDFEDLKAATATATGGLVYGDRLSAAMIRRLACDAKIIPLVLGSKSQPLDVGRAVRLITPGMRKALNHRDKGCVVCGAPPVSCDAHQLKSWIDGGETAVHNLVLLCRRHNSDLHSGHWKITIVNGEVRVTQPSWATPPPHRKRTPTGSTHTTWSNRPTDTLTPLRANPRQGRWSADPAQLQEATRFALGGTTQDRTPGPVLR